MDQNELYRELEISRTSNKYYIFIKKTVKFLIPVSLVSLLLSYALGFSFFFTYNFHFSALVFPLLAHALEKKYTFLVCIGILAFLVKTLNFNSSPLSVSDFNHRESMKGTTEVVENPVSESTLENVALAGEEDELKLQEKANQEVNVSSTSQINEGRQPGGLIVDNEDLDMIEAVEEDTEEGGGLVGASAAEDEVGGNINTEELNKKFEEFIKKTKEEIRIQAQLPQLVTV